MNSWHWLIYWNIKIVFISYLYIFEFFIVPIYPIIAVVSIKLINKICINLLICFYLFGGRHFCFSVKKPDRKPKSILRDQITSRQFVGWKRAMTEKSIGKKKWNTRNAWWLKRDRTLPPPHFPKLSASYFRVARFKYEPTISIWEVVLSRVPLCFRKINIIFV